MGKHKLKRAKRAKYDPKRIMVINQLADNHKVTTDFVRLAINGGRTSETAETIKKEFKQMMESIKQVVTAK